jgi:hypothetical protein
MNADELGKYSKWVDKSALEIRDDVIKVGGWTKVFPRGKLEKWAHRLRNFFNEPPRTVYRVRENEAWRAISKARIARTGFVNSAATDFAFSGDVYKERRLRADGTIETRYWIEQSQAGSRYHSKEEFGVIRSALTPHSMTGNFKLCSGDGTGGSSEWCLHNWLIGPGGRGKRSKVEEGHRVNAFTQGITEPQYRGSYNFADTMLTGFKQHSRLDMEPDEEFGAKYHLTGLGSKGIEWIPLKDRIFRKDFSFD